MSLITGKSGSVGKWIGGTEILDVDGKGTGRYEEETGLIPPFYSDAGSKPDEGAIKSFLKRELKIELHNKQQASLIEALTKPDEWIKKRTTEMNKIADELAPTYANSLKTYLDANYPFDEAVALATKQTEILYQAKLQELNARLPGANNLLTSAYKERKYQGDKAASYNGDETIDYKALWESKMARKAAKKAKNPVKQLTS